LSALSKINYVDRQRIINMNRLIITGWSDRYPNKSEFLDVGTDRIDEVLRIVENAAKDLPFEKH